jgi:hypothetical protein
MRSRDFLLYLIHLDFHLLIYKLNVLSYTLQKLYKYWMTVFLSKFVFWVVTPRTCPHPERTSNRKQFLWILLNIHNKKIFQIKVVDLNDIYVLYYSIIVSVRGF